jgi:aldehyde dehydrogenase (NAD+)
MAITTDERYQLFIGGETVRASEDEYTTTKNPATGEPLAQVAEATADDVNDAVAAARSAFSSWSKRDPVERGRIVRKLGAGIREHAADLANTESQDQGKPLSQARDDIDQAARFFEYYAGAADKLEGESVPLTQDKLDLTVREPYGVSGQIIPWNFPLNLTARGIAPALVTGNTVVIKPAPTTPLTALDLADICKEAGVPDGVVNIVTGGAEPGATLSAHEDIDQLTFTGSVPTGEAVMKSAAETITPVTLELGGKNPAIVMPDANLDEAVEWITDGIFTNCGQTCSATDRAIVHESVYEEFVERATEVAKSLSVGVGTDDPDMGPLNHEEHFETVIDYIEIGKAEGATLETGGKELTGGQYDDGYFVEPTIFSDVSTNMRIAQEEIFGPVLTVMPFSEREEAIEIANDVEFGLTGGVFTENIKKALSMVRDIEAANVYVNEWRFGGSVETPFGGMKKSGIGREKGMEAVDSYLETKNICINLDENRN